jgi:mono/diheme cytochrome c family protein
LFGSRHCLVCHSVNGQGGRTAPDLAQAVGHGFSPYQLTALLWNHAPRMWAAFQAQGIPLPQLSEQDGADLFAYFYSSRFFVEPGDARRGRAVFRAKQCASCHGLERPLRQGIRPVSAWQSLDNPIALAQQMWDHSTEMRRALEEKEVPYPRLSSQELTDLLAYLRGLRGETTAVREFAPGPPASGRTVFREKRCFICHRGAHSLEARPTRHTLTDLTAAMWNHPFQVQSQAAPLTYEEMRDLVGYVVSMQFFEERGDVEEGRKVFQRKHCGRCHDNAMSGAPPRSEMTGRMTSLAIMAALFRHGPSMLERMRREKLSWPHFNGLEMADLSAYLHGLEFRRRTPR